RSTRTPRPAAPDHDRATQRRTSRGGVSGEFGVALEQDPLTLLLGGAYALGAEHLVHAGIQCSMSFAQRRVHGQRGGVLGEGTLRVQSASLEHGLAAGDHLLALLLGDLGQGEVVPDDRGREAKPGFEGSAYGSLPGDEHRAADDAEQEPRGILSSEVGVSCDYTGIEVRDSRESAGL